MTEDILTVIWKESKGLLRYNSSRWKAIATLLTPIVIFGIIFPIQFRNEWLTSGWSVAVSAITPLLLIASTISESFAGERERHTLETLLASRLPDRAILFGKLLMSIIFGWGITLFLLLVSLMVVNIMEWNGGFHIYRPAILWINIFASLLISGMVASLGILISLRSPTVQNATQTIMLMLFMPFLLLQAVVFVLPTFLPKDTVKALFDRMDLTTILFVVLGILVVANIGLLLGAIARFQRARLILAD
jgi:ABC-2 type transport system permease protein